MRPAGTRPAAAPGLQAQGGVPVAVPDSFRALLEADHRRERRLAGLEVLSLALAVLLVLAAHFLGELL